MRTARDVMTRDPLTISADTTFSRAAEQMRLANIRHLVVVNALGRLAGLLGDTEVFGRGWLDEGRWVPLGPELDGATVASAVRPVEAVSPDLDLLALLRLLLEIEEDVVVVVDENRVPVGVFTEYDALRLAADEVRSDLTVEEVMATELVTATPDLELQEAWSELRDNGIRHLPIREGNTLVGVASIRDLLQIGASVTAGGTVAQLLGPTRPLRTTMRAETLRAAALQMAKHKIGCLPVLERDGTLCGLVTATDAIKALLPRGITGGES